MVSTFASIALYVATAPAIPALLLPVLPMLLPALPRGLLRQAPADVTPRNLCGLFKGSLSMTASKLSLSSLQLFDGTSNKVQHKGADKQEAGCK